eukprot:1161137-Pelagomonas_calceolata.AAC.4
MEQNASRLHSLFQCKIYLIVSLACCRQDRKAYSHSIGVHDEEESFASEQLRNAVRSGRESLVSEQQKLEEVGSLFQRVSALLQERIANN